MPLELTAMAVIESALNTKAVSRARAKGMWQFMYSTAKRYGLTINSYVDERFDPIASAHAAARYLRDSYLIFGDWSLAIASYNCGAGNVNKAIRRSGGSKDFWEIYPYLPRETRGYVPSFFAALYAMKYYKEHNLTPEFIPPASRNCARTTRSTCMTSSPVRRKSISSSCHTSTQVRSLTTKKRYTPTRTPYISVRRR